MTKSELKSLIQEVIKETSLGEASPTKQIVKGSKKPLFIVKFFDTDSNTGYYINEAEDSRKYFTSRANAVKYVETEYEELKRKELNAERNRPENAPLPINQRTKKIGNDKWKYADGSFVEIEQATIED